tara:strand:+ start:1576 stop:2343 length:768 start_codon:yes stop_codon:yes gene_type:complete
MNNFNKYSKYYDLFYEDKDYKKEAEFLIELANNFNVNTNNILDLGCGTGLHATEFAKKGFNVLGIDLSKEMVNKANEIRLSKDKDVQSKLKYMCGDIRNFQLDEKFDVIFSLFHVVSYINNNNDLLGALDSIKSHLNEGGIFIFDFWYGPAVLWQRPSNRSKEIIKDNLTIKRANTSEINFNESVVDVNYDIEIKDENGNILDKLNELHQMRYLFLNELDLAARLSGMSLVDSGEWLTKNKPSNETWAAYCILQN